MTNPLPVKECLELREKLEFDQSMSLGDWFFDTKHDPIEPNLCTWEMEFPNTRFVKIPTEPQLMDFAIKMAEERHGGRVTEFSYDSWPLSGNHACNVVIKKCGETTAGSFSGEGETQSQALFALIVEIAEQGKERE